MSTQDIANVLAHVVTVVVRELVDTPSEVYVEQTISGRSAGGLVALSIEVREGEVGQVVGRDGRNIQALRTLVETIAAKNRLRAHLEVLDHLRRA